MTSSSATFERRAFLGMMGAGAFAASVPYSAQAATTAQGATALVQRMVADINRVVSSGQSQNAMYSQFERIFSTYADVPAIARYTLGAAARGASSSQLSAYATAFRGYISRKYGRRFREVIGSEITVSGTRPVRDYMEVRATARLRGQSPFEVAFHVSDKSGSDKVFNIFVEGINMLLAERDEIGALLDRNGNSIDRLTAALRNAS